MQAKDLLVTGDVRVVGDIYSPSLSCEQTLNHGTHIANITMNGVTTSLFAPVAESSGTVATNKCVLTKSGNNIVLTNSIDGTTSTVSDNTYSHPGSHPASMITGLATVATSGSYNDLSNKPSIPAAANNGTLTIQRNGTTVATFTANQSGNSTANISVPTKYSDLTGLPTIPSVGNGTLTIQRNGTNIATFSANQSSGATANISVPTSINDIGGNCVVVSATQPTNSNAIIWVQTVS